MSKKQEPTKFIYLLAAAIEAKVQALYDVDKEAFKIADERLDALADRLFGWNLSKDSSEEFIKLISRRTVNRIELDVQPAFTEKGFQICAYVDDEWKDNLSVAEAVYTVSEELMTFLVEDENGTFQKVTD